MRNFISTFIIILFISSSSLAGHWEFTGVVMNGYTIATNEGIDAVNVPGLKNLYAVGVDPDNRVWAGAYYSRRLENTEGLPDLDRYPDLWYETNGSEIWNLPLFIWDPIDASIDTVRFLAYGDGSQDTLLSHRGIDRSHDGNMIITTKEAVYKVNYQTIEVIARWDNPDLGNPLQYANCDGNGYVYTQGLFGGPVYILDPDDLTYYSEFNTFISPVTRGAAVSQNGNDVYIATTFGGDEHYHSNNGPDGTYAYVGIVGTEVVTTGTTMLDPAGYLWLIACIDQDDDMWSFDPNDNYAVADDTSFTYPTAADTTIYGYFLPEFVRCPRDAAFNTAGNKMYLAEFYGYTIKEYTYIPDDTELEIVLEIPEIYAFSDDTILVPINVEFPMDSSFSSAEISISGYNGKLDFLSVDTSSSLMGSAGWTIQFNETDSLLITAAAGADDLYGEGVLFSLEFAVPDTAIGFIPIMLDSALFDTGAIRVELISGGVNILSSTADYGDVDLNGAIQAFDAAQILKYLVDYIDLDYLQRLNANVSWDSTISALDATLILQYVTGQIDYLPFDSTEQLMMASGSVYMENGEFLAGQLIELPIILNDGQNIRSFEGVITFNTSHLTFEELIWSPIASSCTIINNQVEGEIKFAGSGPIPDGDSDILAILRFTVNENIEASETLVTITKLRFNEGDILENTATAELTNLLSTDISRMPNEFILNQNYPNPFNPNTTISYQIPVPSFVEITVYSLTGQIVETIVYDYQDTGYYTAIWNAEGLSSGLYLYRLSAGDYKKVRKCLIVK